MAPQGGFYRGSAPARRTRWKRRSVRRDGRRYIFVISVWVFDVGIFHFMFLSFIGWHYLHFLEEMLAAQANKPSNTKGGWTPGILDICPSFNGEPLFFGTCCAGGKKNSPKKARKAAASWEKRISKPQLFTCGFVLQAALELNIEGMEQKATVMGWMNFWKSINQAALGP